ncbi:MAG TPA: hypothetical protein VJ691_12620 [Vicinamibacterales bacterium]|nr:hypothetical protein [Vicinamibacterales bacterium]
MPWSKVVAPLGVDSDKWNAAISGTPGLGSLMGYLESCLTFLAVLFLPTEQAGYVVAAWLAFKLASKWETWSNIVKIPEQLNGSAVDQIDYLRARRHWGELLYTRFTAGTLLNLLAGGLLGLGFRELIS